MSPLTRRYEVVELRLGPADAPDSPVDVSFVGPDGATRRVPAFVSAGEWRVRYASGTVGSHAYTVEASDAHLDEPEGTIDVKDETAPGPFGEHGPIQIATDRRHLEHEDGTPFLWLADTWWLGFVDRVGDDEFEELAARRAEQGFSVVQIVAGLYPELEPLAPEGNGASGWPLTEGLDAVNTAWYDDADRRIQILLASGLLPCVFGVWAYYLEYVGLEVLLRHWREMIARWGAYPVVWSLAGEPGLLWYEHPALEPLTRELGEASGFGGRDFNPAMIESAPGLAQRRELNALARGVREIEPFGRPLTLHSLPFIAPWRYLEDPDSVDIWMLQTGHEDANSLAPSVDLVLEARDHLPTKPTINGEVCYEGILGANGQAVQRFLFWSHLLSGAAGHTYGAHGLWNFSIPGMAALHSGIGAGLSWRESVDLPGAAQLALGRRFLIDLPWQEFEPRPDWVEPHQRPDARGFLYAAGVENGPRVVYVPSVVFSLFSWRAGMRLRGLGDRRWRLRIFDPRTGVFESERTITPDADGTVLIEPGARAALSLPNREDWVLLLEPEA